jgi:hypothetical protein
LELVCRRIQSGHVGAGIGWPGLPAIVATPDKVQPTPVPSSRHKSGGRRVSFMPSSPDQISTSPASTPERSRQLPPLVMAAARAMRSSSCPCPSVLNVEFDSGCPRLVRNGHEGRTLQRQDASAGGDVAFSRRLARPTRSSFAKSRYSRNAPRHHTRRGCSPRCAPNTCSSNRRSWMVPQVAHVRRPGPAAVRPVTATHVGPARVGVFSGIDDLPVKGNLSAWLRSPA